MKPEPVYLFLDQLKIEEKYPKELAEAIERLYYWHTGRLTSFSSVLYNLLAKADPLNMIKIALSFHIETYAYLLWYNATDPERFFLKHGFPKKITRRTDS